MFVLSRHFFKLNFVFFENCYVYDQLVTGHRVGPILSVIILVKKKTRTSALRSSDFVNHSYDYHY